MSVLRGPGGAGDCDEFVREMCEGVSKRMGETGLPGRELRERKHLHPLMKEIGARPLQARALHAYGEALAAAGDQQAARSRFEQAEAPFDELGIRPDPEPQVAD